MLALFTARNFEQFTPVSSTEWIIFVVSIGAATLALAFITGIYRISSRRRPWAGPIFAFIVGLCISFIPVQALTYFYEDRMMWLPYHHTAIIFWGDGLGLTSIAAGFAYLRQRVVCSSNGSLRHGVADSLPWRLFVIAVALSISLFYHLHQANIWTEQRLHQPAKVWHDFAVYPIFLYYLGSQLPILWTALRHHLTIRDTMLKVTVGATLVFGGFGLWAWAGTVWDPDHINSQPLLGFASAQPSIEIK